MLSVNFKEDVIGPCWIDKGESEIKRYDEDIGKFVTVML